MCAGITFDGQTGRLPSPRVGFLPMSGPPRRHHNRNVLPGKSARPPKLFDGDHLADVKCWLNVANRPALTLGSSSFVGARLRRHGLQNSTGSSFMNDKVYKLIELTGTSTQSVEDAVNTALKRAGTTIQNLSWFEVLETRGSIEKDRVKHWQVTLKVGFLVE